MHLAVAYCRYSPRPGGESCDSNRMQFQRCRAYCRLHNYQIVGVCWDRELSGGCASNRPGLQRAIALACRHKAVLVVAKLDRMARNTRDALEIADRLHAGKADLASTTEHIDTRSPMGKAFYTLMAVFAELERAQIVERTRVSMRQHQANGRRMTRADRCPFGTMPDLDGPMVPRVDKKTGETVLRPARLIDCPEEQAAIVRIRQGRAAGLSLRQIAARLERDGVRCRGQRWSTSTIRTVLARCVAG